MSIPASNTTVEKDQAVEKWTSFIEKLNSGQKEVPSPFKPVETLKNKYLTKEAAATILDIGCETGKNAIPLLKDGHKVTLLDIASNAVEYTLKNIREKGLEGGVTEGITGRIENLDPKQGPFTAVIGTYAFSFIPPDLFGKVMKDNVLGRVAPGGYFVGGFFGDKHAWAKNPDYSIMNTEKLKELLASTGFTVCEMDEKIEEVPTVFQGQQTFHTIDVIARKTLNPNQPK